MRNWNETKESRSSFYAMATAIGPERRLRTVLGSVSAELARAADVPAIAVKLLDDDEQTLHYVATHGLPATWDDDKTLDLGRSPLNQRCIEGEVLVAGRVESGEPLAMRQELTDLGFRSALLAPLTVGDRGYRHAELLLHVDGSVSLVGYAVSSVGSRAGSDRHR